ncbi:MAG: hypothetical protein ACOH1Q_08750 [Thiobacillus sp.]
MTRVLATLLLLVSCNCYAESVFATIEDYAAWKTGLTEPQICLDYSRSHLQDRTLPVAGIVYPCDPSNRPAVVFVLMPVSQNGFAESAASRPFDISDPSAHTNFESIDLQSAERFSLQHNALAKCGIEVTTFRFAKKPNGWVVSGLDRKRPDCTGNRKTELGAGVGEELSVNFLNGRIARRTFRNDRLVETKSWRKRFPKFLLADFEQSDQRFYFK